MNDMTRSLRQPSDRPRQSSPAVARRTAARLLPLVAALAWAATLPGCSGNGEPSRSAGTAGVNRLGPDAFAPPSRASAAARATPDVARQRTPAPTTRPNREGESATEALAFPTGDRASSVLLVEKVFPAQARLGKAYRYELKVTNLTDHPISGVIVRERVPDSFRIARAPAGPADAGAVPAGATVPGGPDASPPTQPAANAVNAANVQPREAIDIQDGQESQQFVVGDLGPRQSKSVTVTGVAGRLGKLATFTSVSYTPLLAGGTEVINPILRLSKEGPMYADLCSEITYRYLVSNVGTGTETNVRIEDPLPAGLTTLDGKRAIAIDVGNLGEGVRRDYTVRLKAAAVGRYASRSTARGAGTEAQSQELATTVQAPRLTVAVTGPTTEYVGKTAAYDLVVTNTGDAPARDTLVGAAADRGAELVFFAGIRPDAPEPKAPASVPGAPGVAGPPGVRDAVPSQNLGTIEPGQSKKARVAFRPTQGGPVTVSVTAKATCADAASAKAATNVLTIASLALEVQERDNLVRVGEDAVYTIKVKNQGSGADRNVRVVATLPAPMALVKTTGPTDAKVDGQQLVFAPLPTLAPGETVTWTVEAKASQAADVRFRVELTSESLTEPAMETAPTKLY